MLMVFQGKWCVAKPMTSDDLLQANIDFACNHVDCGLIRYGGGCYYPDTLINHASVIMNLYYQANGREDMSCYFKNTGCIVMKDPSKPILLSLSLIAEKIRLLSDLLLLILTFCLLFQVMMNANISFNNDHQKKYVVTCLTCSQASILQ